MARMTEVKFGDLQVDQRYKKLQRDLKLTLLRKKHEQPDKSIPSHIPDINIDVAKSNASTPVSSSKNLNNMLPNNKFCRQSDCNEDCHIMQPPDSYKIPFTSKKPMNTVIRNEKSFPLSENTYISSYMKFNGRKLSFIPSDILEQCTDTVSSEQSDSNNIQSKKAKVFTEWKVMLTEQGQLVIKGKLQCGKIAQSKPVIRKLTSTSIESVCKDLYHLEGNIVDNEHELPEYVKGKFYNGFPDDWENVHQIWRTFVEQGCRVSFRWPAPIADSDDDLKSEVTDVTYLYSENPKHRVSNLRFPKKSQTLGMLYHSDYSFDISQREHDKTFSIQSCMKRDSCTQTSICGVSENSFYNVNIRSPSNQYGCNVECVDKQENMNLEYSKDKDKLKTKFNAMLNNLLDKNCPKKCITEIIEMVECFKYVMLHKSTEDNESSMEELKPGNYRSEQSKEISNDSEKLESISMMKDTESDKSMCNNQLDHPKYIARKEDNIVSNNITDGGKSLPKKRTFTEMNKDNDSDSFESENEIYAGVPKIPVELLSRRREGLTKPYKRKIKKVVHQECNVTSKQRVSNVSSAETCVLETRSKHTNNILLNDSDVKEYERCFSRAKSKDINPNISNEINQPVDLNIGKEQWNGLNDLNKDKNMHEAQKCFLGENPTPARPSMNNFYNSFGRMKNYELESTSTEKYTKIKPNSNAKETIREVNSSIKETRVEANFDMKTNDNETSDKVENYSQCKPSKEFLFQLKNNDTKPAIISLVPVNIKIKNSRSKNLSRKSGASIVKNEKKNIKELNKENKNNSSIQNESPRKFYATRNANSTLLSDSKKNIEKHIQLGSVDSTSSKLSTQTNLEMFKGNQQDTSYCKPKLLTGWVPKVLCESELSLIFEGTLLNDAGHVICKKFQTDIVLRRVSPKLIETVHHEFYQLIGDVNDTKHVIPEQLKNKCRHGCPFKIDQFCETWKVLKSKNDANSTDIMENLNDDTLADTVNIGVSSKGRKIMRPLSYWTGERIMLKDNNPVYTPGTLQESLNQNKFVKTIRTPGNNDNMKSSSDESEDTEKTVNKTKSNTKQIASSKSKRLLTNHKRRTDVQVQESYHSSDSENLSPSKKYREKTIKQRWSDLVSATTKQDAHSMGVEKSPEPYERLDETKSGKKSTKTNEITGSNSLKRKSRRQEFSAGEYRDVVCTYFRNIPFKDDILSEDQQSHV